MVTACLHSTLAFSDSRPEWTQRAPKHDSQYKFYVGRSSNSATESSAYAEAYSDAVLQAIRDNFGFSASVESQTYEAADKATLVQRVQEASKNIQFKGFEQVEAFLATTDGKRFNVWILYRYSKKDIAREKRRLESIKDNPKEIIFSEQGHAGDASKGIIEISTEPTDVEITIDGRRWGMTPLRILGRLGFGEHRIVLEHDDYDPVEETFIVGPNSKTKIHKVLVRSKGTLEITSNPQNASVIVNGRFLGSTPIEKIDVPSGEKILIEFSHPEAERHTQEVTVSRNEDRIVNAILPLKPAVVVLASDPKGASVEIEGKSYTTPTGRMKVTPGIHKIVLSKEGYHELEATIEVRGGQKISPPAFRMESVTEVEKNRERLFKKASVSGFSLYSMGTSVKSSSDFNLIQIGTHLERFISENVSLNLRLSAEQYFTSYSEGSDDSKVDKVSGQGYFAAFGIPLYLDTREENKKEDSRVRGGFLFSPELVYGSQSITVDSQSKSYQTVPGYGCRLGFGFKFPDRRIYFSFEGIWRTLLKSNGLPEQSSSGLGFTWGKLF